MSTFQDRIKSAFSDENARRISAGEKQLAKKDLWAAAGRSSGAASHWFGGGNGADMDACLKIAPLLRVNPHWLFDESKPREEGVSYDRVDSVVRVVRECETKPYVHPNETTRRIIALLDETDEAGRGAALHAVMQALKEYRPTKNAA